MHSVTNWLQSSPDNGSDIDQDQFLLNANDMFSDDAWSSYNESDTEGNNAILETNDEYIDDDIFHNDNANAPLPELSPGPVEPYSPNELDHYFLDPEGLNLVDPFDLPERQNNNSLTNDGDPEPNPGPFDPGQAVINMPDTW